MSSLEWILKYKLVAILRGVKPADILKTAEALHEGGIRVLEITLNSEDALNQISVLNRHFYERMLIGAGTVLDIKGAEAAKNAGAAFLISPGLDTDVVKFTKDSGLVSIPGAYTATEVMNADKAGADIVKIFPVSNAEYLKNLHAPLDRIRMMPTGGINAENIKQFSNAGAVAFGIGSALVSKTTNADLQYLENIKEKAKTFTEVMSSF